VSCFVSHSSLPIAINVYLVVARDNVFSLWKLSIFFSDCFDILLVIDNYNSPLDLGYLN